MSDLVGVIGAMAGEVQGLKNLMENVTVHNRSGMDFYSGKLFGEPAVVVRSGVGKVNAGICAAILIHLFEADVLINTGVAGSLNNDIDIGDIVISTDAVQHDFDATKFGKFKYGEIPWLENSYFKADERLRKIAEEASKKTDSDIKVFSGRIVSGDQFISDDEKKNWLSEQFGGYCTEMEGAAIAQAAYLSGVPFLIVRAISDKADHSTTVDFIEFEKKAAERSIKLTSEIIKNLKEVQ